MNSTRMVLIAATLAVALVGPETVVRADARQAVVSVTPDGGGPGTTITIDGQCQFPGLVADDVSIRVFLLAPQPGVPYAFIDHHPPIGPNQTVHDVVTLPQDVINGDYLVEISCFLQDQGLGVADTPFTVTGGIDGSTVTTTSTSTTSTTISNTSTTAPLTSRPPGSSPSTSPPEAPVAPRATPAPGNASFAG